MMLFIIHNTEDDGLAFDAIAKSDFDSWVKEHTADIKPEYHPIFVEKLNANSPTNHFLLIEGTVKVPKPITTVTSYIL